MPPAHPPAVWSDRIAGSPAVPLTDLAARGARLLLVSPHPDDETIGAGRLVAGWARAIGPVHAVLLTEGEACFDHLGPRPEGLGARRVAEWRAACAELGATPLGCSGLPDHGLTGAVEQVRDVIATLAPAVDAVAAPWHGDPHPDHAATGAVAREVAAAAGLPLLAYPVWTTYRLLPHEVRPDLTRVTTDPADDAARERALARYPSQTTPPAPGEAPVVPAAFLDHHGEQLLVVDAA